MPRSLSKQAPRKMHLRFRPAPSSGWPDLHTERRGERALLLGALRKVRMESRGRCLHFRRRTPRHRPLGRREHVRHQAHRQPRRQRSDLAGWHRQQDRHRPIGRRALRLDHGRALQLHAVGDEQPRRNCTGTCGGQECECQHRVCVGPDGAFWDRWEADQNFSVCESEP